MNNNDRRNVRYEEKYEDVEREMMSERTAFARDIEADEREYSRPKREFANSKCYERYIDEKPERCIDDDLVPSETTMQFVGEERVRLYEAMNAIDDKDNYVAAKEGLSGRNKIMIAVYAIVVLTIFTLIVLNTRLLKTMDMSIDEQEAQVSELVLENTRLSERYSVVSSDEEITRRAEELGMVCRE